MTGTTNWVQISRRFQVGAVLFTGLLLVLAVAVPAAPGQRHHARSRVTYRTYANGRFAYAISYPEGVLYPQGEPDNGDGQKIMSAHADAVLTVFGRYNALDETLASLYSDACRGGTADAPKRVVTYHVLRPHWFVVSGHDGGQIFYEKLMLNGDVIRSLSFVYPERQKSFYDPIAAKIARSFRIL